MQLKRMPKFASRPPRTAVSVDTNVFLPDDREVSVTLTNLSVDGFTAATEAEILPATMLGINVPGFGIRRAQVRWSAANEFGGRFEKRLPAVESF